MIKIVFATGNKDKIREAAEILGGKFDLLSSSQIGVVEDIPETGNTLEDNSLQKAKYIYDHAGGVNCFADDTGLEVDILGGAPGVYSARYAGEPKSFTANMDKLLKEMAEKEKDSWAAGKYGRRARFRTVVTLFYNGEKYQFEGTMEGKIARQKAGNGGFGYDPVFIADDYPDKTVAELDDATKNAISHRGKALRAMSEFLKTLESV